MEQWSSETAGKEGGLSHCVKMTGGFTKDVSVTMRILAQIEQKDLCPCSVAGFECAAPFLA